MCITRSAVHRLMLVTLFTLLFACATVTPVAAQTAPADEACAVTTGEYASWLDKLESLRGTLTASFNETDREDSVNATFAIVNTGNLERLDYFVQMKSGENNYRILLVKDNFAAGLENYGRGWEVALREEAYQARDLEQGFFRADEFLKTAFKELRLLELSTCLGSETVAGQETVHYHLDIPPMLARMLISQLGGNGPNDVEFGTVGSDFWLDKTNGYLTKLEVNLEIIEANSGVSIVAALELNSVNNVQLKVPEYIRLLAMQQGLIEPDFTQEFIALEE